MKRFLLIAAIISAAIGAWIFAPARHPSPVTPQDIILGGTAPTDTFETYSNGNDVNGLNGGSGWAGAYSASSGGVWSITNSNPGQGSLSFYITRTNPGGGEPYITRQLSTPIADLTNIKFMIRRGGANSNNNSYNFSFKPDSGDLSANGYYAVSFNTASNIEMFARGGSTITIVSGASQNTWYYCVMQIDPANYRMRSACSTSPIVSEPTWSSYSTGNSGSINGTSMGYMTMSVGGANNGQSDYQVDDIGPWSVVIPAPTFSGDIIMFE